MVRAHTLDTSTNWKFDLHMTASSRVHLQEQAVSNTSSYNTQTALV